MLAAVMGLCVLKRQREVCVCVLIRGCVCVCVKTNFVPT